MQKAFCWCWRCCCVELKITSLSCAPVLGHAILWACFRYSTFLTSRNSIYLTWCCEMCFTDYQSLLLQPITLPKWFKISKVFSWRTQERKVLFLITTGLQKYTNSGPCQKFTEVWIIDTSEQGISELPFCLCIKTSLSEKPYENEFPFSLIFMQMKLIFKAEILHKHKTQVTRKWPLEFVNLSRYRSIHHCPINYWNCKRKT